MTRITTPTARISVVALLAGVLLCGGCVRSSAEGNAGAPPPLPVHEEGDGSWVQVDRPDQFPLATAIARRATSELSVTGVVEPDVSRAVPVVSLASGRVIEVRVRLGDTVRKGQLLLRVQSADMVSALADYRKAVADDELARIQLERATVLFDRGAVAKKDLEVVQSTTQKAVVELQTAAERLRVLGGSTDQSPTGIVEIVAPVSGIITEQNITTAGGVKSLDSSPNLLTISDLSHVWIMCDVYENDLRQVRVGDAADIHLAPYPDRVLAGRIGNIAPILDPSLRTAKVRIEVANPGLMRVGMFVNAALHDQSTEIHAVVPATAILHLHDRDWVYVPEGKGRFRRREVVSGQMLPGQQQEVRSGLEAGEPVVADALTLQNTVEQ